MSPGALIGARAFSFWLRGRVSGFDRAGSLGAAPLTNVGNVRQAVCEQDRFDPDRLHGHFAAGTHDQVRPPWPPRLVLFLLLLCSLPAAHRRYPVTRT